MRPFFSVGHIKQLVTKTKIQTQFATELPIVGEVKTVIVENENLLSVMPYCVSASVALPVRSCVKESNFSNSVACSSGKFVWY